MQDLMVTKRDGEQEKIDLEKIHRVIHWAAEGLQNVSVSQVEIKSHIQFFDGIRTEDIHETIIKSAADLISEETPDYQYLAARLAIFHLRKKAFGQFEPPHLYDHVQKMVADGRYDSALSSDYTEEEYNELNDHLDHGRDMNFSYAAVKQMEGKYLVQNRVTGQMYESPQILYMLVGACLFSNYPQDTRLDYVKRFYDACSLFKLSLPTPIMAGVRTPTRQFSSCVLIECGDSLESINATASAIVPAMAIAYVLMSLIVIGSHIEQVPGALATIIDSAFNGASAAGGFAGATVWAAIRFGVARGIFSNEAGLGSAPIAHAAAKTNEPVEQGLVAMLGTFIDTLVVCTMTGLVIMLTGVLESGVSGASLTASAFGSALPGGELVVTLGVVLFATTTMIGWSFYGERCVVYLFGTKGILPFRILWVLAIPVGAGTDLGLIWLVADTLNAFMAIPNLIALLLLSPLVFKLSRSYFSRRSAAAESI